MPPGRNRGPCVLRWSNGHPNANGELQGDHDDGRPAASGGESRVESKGEPGATARVRSKSEPGVTARVEYDSEPGVTVRVGGTKSLVREARTMSNPG